MNNHPRKHSAGKRKLHFFTGLLALVHVMILISTQSVCFGGPGGAFGSGVIDSTELDERIFLARAPTPLRLTNSNFRAEVDLGDERTHEVVLRIVGAKENDPSCENRFWVNSWRDDQNLFADGVWVSEKQPLNVRVPLWVKSDNNFTYGTRTLVSVKCKSLVREDEKLGTNCIEPSAQGNSCAYDVLVTDANQNLKGSLRLSSDTAGAANPTITIKHDIVNRNF